MKSGTPHSLEDDWMLWRFSTPIPIPGALSRTNRVYAHVHDNSNKYLHLRAIRFLPASTIALRSGLGDSAGIGGRGIDIGELGEVCIIRIA
jgi:hypothetical protein